MVVYQMIEKASYMEMVTFITITVAMIILFSLTNYFKQVIIALRTNGPTALPFVGNILMIADKNVMLEQAGTAFHTYGQLIRLWVGFLPSFMLLDPDDIQSVLASKKHTEKIFAYKFLHNFLGKGLITTEQDKWSLHRKLIQPTFHLSILEKFISTFADGALSLKQKIDSQTGPVNITEFVNSTVLQMLNETVFGVPILKSENIKSSPFREGKIVMPDRLTKPWLMLDWIYKLTETASSEINQKNRLDEFTKNVIAKRRQDRENNVVPERQCLLDFMIDIADNNKDFTEDDIVNEASTFMLAGQDSVGASTAFALFLIAKHTECQKKCIEELDSIFQGDTRAPTMSDLKNMTYLEQCIKEGLRLYPSVPLFARKLGEEVKMQNHVMPVGTNVFFITYSIHRLPHIYPDPEKYDPERFTAENCAKRHPFAFIPFSAGPRNCIGYKYAMFEMKALISQILRNYTMHTIPGKENIIPSFRVTLRAKGGLWIKFQKRETIPTTQLL